MNWRRKGRRTTEEDALGEGGPQSAPARSLVWSKPPRGSSFARTPSITTSRALPARRSWKQAIVSPIDCVGPPLPPPPLSPRAPHGAALRVAASRHVYLVHSRVLCGRCCTRSCRPRTARDRRTAGRCTARRERRTRCPSSRCSTDSAPWCTGRYRCTGPDRRLRRDDRPGERAEHKAASESSFD